MEFETPRSLLGRLNLGREEALQRMLTCLILRAPYPRWNSRSPLSAEGRSFLDSLSRLSFGTGLDGAAPMFVDELELPGRERDERGGAPDWAVLLPDRLWIIELKTEAASHRSDQIPMYFELGHHHFPGIPVDITYLTPRGTATHESPDEPDRFAHLTWEDIRSLISSVWSTPSAPGEADVVNGVLRTIDGLDSKPPEWRRAIIWDADDTPVVIPDPASIGVPSATGESDWPSAVEATAADHAQRAIDTVAASLDELLALRHEINDHCRTALDPRVAHVRPWLWRTASGGTAMTEGGRTTGYEIRISRYSTSSSVVSETGGS